MGNDISMDSNHRSKWKKERCAQLLPIVTSPTFKPQSIACLQCIKEGFHLHSHLQAVSSLEL
jgi:hypothetical protein